jgi:hypothetical protein
VIAFPYLYELLTVDLKIKEKTAFVPASLARPMMNGLNVKRRLQESLVHTGRVETADC